MVYQVVEFADKTVQAIPEKWINESKEACLYPPTDDDMTIMKAVCRLETPKEDWRSCQIIRLLGKPTDNWSRAVEKEKLAQQFSDLDSETEKEKRKFRAAKMLRYDDEQEEEERPKKQKKTSDFRQKNLPKLPMPPTKKITPVQKTTNSTTILNVPVDIGCDVGFEHLKFFMEDEAEISASEPIRPIEINMETSYENEPILRRSPRKQTATPKSSPPKSAPPKSAPTISALPNSALPNSAPPKRKTQFKTDRDLLTEILRKQNLLIHKINNLETAVSILNQGGTPAASEMTQVDSFPLKTREQLDEFEEICQRDPTHINKCVTALRSLGGGTVQNVVIAIMKRVLANSIAKTFSLCGRKKNGFKGLNLYKVVLQTAITLKKEANEKEIDAAIARWLIQSKQRSEREDKRTNDGRAENNQL